MAATDGAASRANSRRSQPNVTKAKLVLDDQNTRKQVIKMLIAIILLFVVCWGPILINNVLVACGLLPKLNLGYFKPLRKVFYAMGYFNSCVNPIVYGFMSRNFRDSFRYALCKCIKGRQYARQYMYAYRHGRYFSTCTTCTTHCTTHCTTQLSSTCSGGDGPLTGGPQHPGPSQGPRGAAGAPWGANNRTQDELKDSYG